MSSEKLKKGLILCLMLAPLVLPQTSQAQENNPPQTYQANPEDVASVDAIIAALYDVISGPKGERRDWQRFRSLLLPTAHLVPVFTDPQGNTRALTWNADAYIARVDSFFYHNGFFEREIYRKAERYGNVVHGFSTYESRRNLDDPDPIARGINSIQVLFFQDRWWIANITWQQEQPGLPIPEAYLPRP